MFAICIEGKKGRLFQEKTKNIEKLDIERRPGETQIEYYQRLDKQAAEQVNKILVKEKRISQKRKQYVLRNIFYLLFGKILTRVFLWTV